MADQRSHRRHDRPHPERGERQRAKVSTPASKLRERVLDVLQSEGYIRGYSTDGDRRAAREFEIELKYFDGQPVIAEIEPRVQAGPPGLFARSLT